MVQQATERIMVSEILRRLDQAEIRLRSTDQSIAKFEYTLEDLETRLDAMTGEIRERVKKNEELATKLSANIDEIKAMLKATEDRLANLATKNEVKELSNYVNILSPATSVFVTKDEVKRMLEEGKTR